MIEVSIIVQMREAVDASGKKGPLGIGVMRFNTTESTPEKSWNRKFEEACRRALNSHTARRATNQTPAQGELQLEEPTCPKPPRS